jgi:3-hydroxyisobutyrate dehydrogenase-like beta-hydroxyacid dehydrogenase
MKIAILGAGHMGRAVGKRLLRSGHAINVWNRSPGKTSELESMGAAAAPTIREAVSGAEAVLMSLTAVEAVKAVALGPEGAIASLSPGAILADMSTVSPDTSRELAATTPARRFVDAPILGGPEATENGKAKLLLGGDEGLIGSYDALWRDIANEYYYCGESGTATTLKLLSNLMLVGGTALLAEAIVTAQRSGVDNAVLKSVFKQSPAIAPGVAVRFDDILEGDHEGWWTVKLAEKDMSLALGLAQKQRLHLPVADASVESLERADEAGLGQKDLGAVVEPLRTSR